MNKNPVGALPGLNACVYALATCGMFLLASNSQAATTTPKRLAATPSTVAPCNTIESAPLVNVTVGKSFRLKTPSPISRILLGNPEGSQAAQPKESTDANADKGKPSAGGSAKSGVADVDVILLSPSEIYLLGKSVGSTNIILLGRNGQCTLVDVAVGADTASLQSSLNQLLSPGANNVKVSAAADSLVLTGTVADTAKLDRAMTLAEAYAGKSKVINMLSVDAPQQVLLEVKIAEISKKLLDKLGVNIAGILNHGGWTYSWNSLFANDPLGKALLSGINDSGTRAFQIDAQHDDGLLKVLAEPNLMAISGQEGSFLAGGKIFIPVAQSNTNSGGSTITLEEKEFGVALRFTPTVLDGGRINLKVAPEVSELNPEGVGISAIGVAGKSILPSFTTRRAATTVQLHDGQSFAIGGLLKNNVTTNISAFPFLGEIPILGALFRSTSFQTDKSELVFVVTPRLVKPLPPDYKLPTDNYIPPNRAELFLGGRMEGRQPEPSASKASDASPQPEASTQAPSGFEVK
ncbi:type II and III secretion system protein family protein [Pseudogulbenkiania subflava]|uniref:Pilus assembly protein CpaC n=1 Tax=Pseudogulbenkiania subflava DSM 22618 TaxID=1123014 RepID=A0A1Y6BMA6_9NEIS|nr:type II and III secretion system protein family protein [Pseudogulbenkiania subflava]SMF10860.1 pilus assembly protein CpaC [Pseudogulbenkiania subflava DSM 22618]